MADYTAEHDGRCEHRLTYSFDRCEQEATTGLEWHFDGFVPGGPSHLCSHHATREAETIQAAGGKPVLFNL